MSPQEIYAHFHGVDRFSRDIYGISRFVDEFFPAAAIDPFTIGDAAGKPIIYATRFFLGQVGGILTYRVIGKSGILTVQDENDEEHIIFIN